MRLKMYFFVPSVGPCMHHNYGVISGRHTSMDCVWPITLVAGLCTTCRSEQVLVGRHQVQWNLPPYEALLKKNVYLFLERCKKSKHVWLHALVQSDCLYLSFFEHYNRILLCDCVPGPYCVSLRTCAGHNAFVRH